MENLSFTPRRLQDDPVLTNEKLEFQSMSWFDSDDADGEEETQNYFVYVYGVTEDGKSVCLKIKNYQPWFYIELPKKYDTPLNRGNVISNLRQAYFAEHIVFEECKYVQKKSFYGYEENFRTMLRLVFKNQKALRQAQFFFKKPNKLLGIPIKMNVFEAKEPGKISCMISYIHAQKLKTSGWLSVDTDALEELSEEEYTTQFGFSTDYRNVVNIEKDTVAPFLQASFDIECYSDTGRFPDPFNDTDVITTIATAFKIYGQPEFLLKHVITLKKSAPLQIETDSVLECYDTEQEVLMAWRDLIMDMDPDIFYTYNGDKFDWMYLVDRARRYPECYSFYDMSRFPGHTCDKKKATFSSGARGTEQFARVSIPGRINYDICIYVRQLERLQSYKLDHVAEHFLGKKKHDVTPQDIFDFFREGTPEKIRLVAEYCIQDTVLPQLIVDKLDMLVIQLEMANLTRVPLNYLFEKGQMIKSYSTITYDIQDKDYAIPQLFGAMNKVFDYPLTGGHVFDPIPGAYYVPITTLDFASLYPTIMMAHNMCYTTVRLDKIYEDEDHYTTPHMEDAGRAYSFNQKTDGIIPGLLNTLYKSRKATKKLMNAEKDPFKKAVLNGRQLAIKVTMNSFYGFLSAPMLNCKPIGSSVTATGRKMLQDVKKEVESPEFIRDIQAKMKLPFLDTRVVYGDTDSVFVEFITEETKKLATCPENKLVAMKEAFRIGEYAGDYLTEKMFKKPIFLEFEKVYNPVFHIRKKFYIGALHEKSPEKPDYIDSKGVVSKRRDNCFLLRDTYEKVIDMLMAKKGNIGPTLEYVESVLKRLENNEIPFEHYIVTKRLSAVYAGDCNATDVLARKIKARSPGSEPVSGDRVPYVTVCVKNPNAKFYEKVEDPEFAQKNGLHIDRLYYLTNSFSKPISVLLGLFMENPESVFDRTQMIIEKQNALLYPELNNMKPITAFFEVSESKQRKEPERQKTVAKTKTNSIASYFKK